MIRLDDKSGNSGKTVSKGNSKKKENAVKTKHYLDRNCPNYSKIIHPEKLYPNLRFNCSLNAKT